MGERRNCQKSYSSLTYMGGRRNLQNIRVFWPTWMKEETERRNCKKSYSSLTYMGGRRNLQKHPSLLAYMDERRNRKKKLQKSYSFNLLHLVGRRSCTVQTIL